MLQKFHFSTMLIALWCNGKPTRLKVRSHGFKFISVTQHLIERVRTHKLTHIQITHTHKLLWIDLSEYIIH